MDTMMTPDDHVTGTRHPSPVTSARRVTPPVAPVPCCGAVLVVGLQGPPPREAAPVCPKAQRVKARTTSTAAPPTVTTGGPERRVGMGGSGNRSLDGRCRRSGRGPVALPAPPLAWSAGLFPIDTTSPGAQGRRLPS